MADGRSFHVPHPDFLSMSPTGRTVIIYQEGEEFSILDLLLMTEIEMAQPTVKKTESPSVSLAGRGKLQ